MTESDLRFDPVTPSRVPDELRAQVEALGPWYQNIELGNGISTRPDHPHGNHPQDRLDYLAPYLAANLTGKSVLDIGCNAGFFCLEMKRRGAARVVGIDLTSWTIRQALFIRDYFDLDIDYRQMDCYDIAELGEAFDVVIFLGVLYHLKHPLLMLERIRRQCRDLMLFQSFTLDPSGELSVPDDISIGPPPGEPSILHHPAFPRLSFVEKQANGDLSNWWFPNWNALMAMLRAAGFSSIQETASTNLSLVYAGSGPPTALPLEGIEQRSRHLESFRHFRAPHQEQIDDLQRELAALREALETQRRESARLRNELAMRPTVRAARLVHALWERSLGGRLRR